MKRKTFENEISAAYDKGELRSEKLSKSKLKAFREAAGATFIKDRRVNVRLSSADLLDLRARAAEEGIPYQTLIASVIHKFVTGRFVEKPSQLTVRSKGRSTKQNAA